MSEYLQEIIISWYRYLTDFLLFLSVYKYVDKIRGYNSWTFVFNLLILNN